MKDRSSRPGDTRRTPTTAADGLGRITYVGRAENKAEPLYSHTAFWNPVQQVMPLTPLARNRKEIIFLRSTKTRPMLYLTLRRFMSVHSFQTAPSPQRPEGPARPAPRPGQSSALRSGPRGEPRPPLSGREGGFAKLLENRKIHRAPAAFVPCFQSVVAVLLSPRRLSTLLIRIEMVIFFRVFVKQRVRRAIHNLLLAYTCMLLIV